MLISPTRYASSVASSTLMTLRRCVEPAGCWSRRTARATREVAEPANWKPGRAVLRAHAPSESSFRALTRLCQLDGTPVPFTRLRGNGTLSLSSSGGGLLSERPTTLTGVWGVLFCAIGRMTFFDGMRARAAAAWFSPSGPQPPEILRTTCGQP